MSGCLDEGWNGRVGDGEIERMVVRVTECWEDVCMGGLRTYDQETIGMNGLLEGTFCE